MRGEPELNDLARRQADPAYSAQKTRPALPNAFVNPNAPGAVFPKKAVHKLIDYRSSVIEESRTAQPINFRKKTRSQYSTKVWTAEQLKEQEVEEMAKMLENKLETGTTEPAPTPAGPPELSESDSDEELESHLDRLRLGAAPKDITMKSISDKKKVIRKGRRDKKGRRNYKSYKLVNF